MINMMYPFMTLDDETEITHSECFPDGRVKVYVEKADEREGFCDMTCYLPNYEIVSVHGFSQEEQDKYMEIIRFMAYLIMGVSKDGGPANAVDFVN